MIKEIRNRVLGHTNSRPILADLLLQSTSSPTLIFVHGFKGFKDWGAWNTMAQFFSTRGYNFIKINLSHNGGTVDQVEDFPDLEAFGRNTFSFELDDIKTVLDRITIESEEFKSVDPLKIALIGHSRGGAMSIIHALEDKRIGALITLNAVTNIIDWMRQFDEDKWRADGVLWAYNSRTEQNMPLYIDLLDDFQQNIHRFDVLNRIDSIGIPVLNIHCKDDKVVSYLQAKDMSEACNTAQLYLIEEGGHTLGARHPMGDGTWPDSLNSACERIHHFFKELDWIEE